MDLKTNKQTSIHWLGEAVIFFISTRDEHTIKFSNQSNSCFIKPPRGSAPQLFEVIELFEQTWCIRIVRYDRKVHTIWEKRFTWKKRICTRKTVSKNILNETKKPNDWIKRLNTAAGRICELHDRSEVLIM